MWKTTPKENMSHFEVYVFTQSLDFIFSTSGATYPGVPHLTQRYSFCSQYSANPKSTITGNISFGFYGSFFTIIFSSFKSLCIIPLSCIQNIPSSRPLIIRLTLTSLGKPYFCRYPYNEKLNNSIITQVEFYVSNTPSNLQMFLWLNFVRNLNYFLNDILII